MSHHHQVFQKQILAPTGVELCIKTNLINDDSINLVLAKTNLLQVYRIKYDKIEKYETVINSQQDILNSLIDKIEDGSGNNGNNNEQPQTTKKKIEFKPSLELLIEKKLFGSIESMACVRYPNSNRDSLILTFRDAKISILDYNPDLLDFEIRSLHYYEKDDLKGGKIHFKNPPLLKVDTQQRCAVMLLYDRNIVVLPFKKTSSILDDDEDDDEDEEIGSKEDTNQQAKDDEFDLLFESSSNTNTSTKPTTTEKKKKNINKLNSFIIELKSVQIKNVKDFCFLHGYYEPTILFLHEPKNQTWTSRIASKRLTSELTAISLNLSTKASSIIWNVVNFPYNCEMLVSVPEPLGGALVITANIMFYVNQTSKYGLGVNEYSKIDVGLTNGSNQQQHQQHGGANSSQDIERFEFPIDDTLNLVFTLDRSSFVFLESDKFIGSLKGGELLIFHLISDGRSVQRIHVSKAGGSVLTSCICVLSNNLIFLGSRLGDSLLLQYTEKSITDDQLEHENFSNPYKKQKTSEVFDLFENQDDQQQQLDSGTNGKSNNTLQSEIEDEEDELFKEKKNQLKSYQLGICDQIINIGPIGDMVIGQSIDPTYDDSTSPSQPEYISKSLELVTCSGYGKNGSISVLQNNIKPELLMAFELPGILSAWTVYKEFDPTSTPAVTAPVSKKRTINEIDEEDDLVEDKEQTEEEQKPDEIDTNWHSYLYLSLKDGTTLIFETGSDLKEVGKFSFKSLEISNLFDRKRIVIVHENGIRLINGHDTVVQDIIISNPIKSCYICDPFILISHFDGSIQLYQGNQQKLLLSEFKLHSSSSSLNNSVISSSLFIDKNYSFLNINNKNHQHTQNSANGGSGQPIKKQPIKKDKSRGFLESDSESDEEVPDEDEMDEEVPIVEEPVVEELKVNVRDEDNIYLCIYTTFGYFEIYRLKSWELVFKVSNIKLEYDIMGINTSESQTNILEQVLQPKFNDSKFKKSQAQQPPQPSQSTDNINSILNNETLEIVEISLHNLSNSNQDTPYLFIINRIGDLIIYKSFLRPSGELRFKKYNHSFITRDSVDSFIQKQQEKELLNQDDLDDGDGEGKDDEDDDQDDKLYRKKRIFQFNSIGNKRGLFISGKKPLWAFCEKGYLRIHSMDNTNGNGSDGGSGDSTIKTFTPFHNVNCSYGFIYFSQVKQVLRICNLSNLMNFENEIAIRRIPTKNNCHKIAYHSEAKCYVVIVSFPQVTQEGLEEDSKKPILTDDKFQIKLIDPTIDWSWKFVDSFSLLDRETVLAMKIVSLKFTEPDGITRPRPFLVIGTAFTFGEDTQCKGRVLVFEIVLHKTQFESEELGEKRLNLLYEKEQKGPVTALSSVNGLLLMTIGPKLTVNQFYTGQLITLSFYDAQIYICTICTIKNYIVIGDMYKSVYFLQWKDNKTLNLLSKDYQSLNIFSTEFIVNQKTLSILVSDLDKNILLFSFEPQDPASRSGQMLLTKADFHIGSNIEKFIRTPMKQSSGNGSKLINGSSTNSPPPPQQQQVVQHQQQQHRNHGGHNNYQQQQQHHNTINNGMVDNRIPKKEQLVIFGTLDGGLNVLRPLDEKMYLLFYHLQSKLYYLPQTAGLNPKQYRSFKSFSQNFHFSPSTYHQLPKYILDGDLISKFLALNQCERKLIASSVNSTFDEIIDSLKQVFESWNLF